jgi:FixJ family two-component response regulator
LETGVKPVVAIIDDDQSVREGISYLINSMGSDNASLNIIYT